jgi:hypothetical protein
MRNGTIGAGMGLLLRGDRLTSHGRRVRLFDKGRGGLVAEACGRPVAWDGEEILP